MCGVIVSTPRRGPIEGFRHVGPGLVDRLGLRQIVLGVIAGNEPAVRLYRRCGFREYGRLEGFFGGESGSAEKLFMVFERS